MDLRGLRYFVAVAEELHFGRAARRLNMSQPPLSQQIQQLERELGGRLLVRGRHKIELTHAGLLLLAEARQILASTERATRVVRNAGRHPAGALRLGFTEPLASIVAPPLLHSLAERYPAVVPSLHEMPTADQSTAVRYGELDIGMLWETISESSGTELERLVLFESPLMIVMAPQNALAQHPMVTFEQLAAQELLLFRRETSPHFHDAVMEALRSHGITRAPLPCDGAGIIHLVAAGVGVSFSSSIQSLIADVVLRPLRDPFLSVVATLVWRRDNTLPALAAFLEVARSMAGSGHW